jgi:hypothetical protein
VLQDLQKLSSKRKLADGLRQRADTPASKK